MVQGLHKVATVLACCIACSLIACGGEDDGRPQPTASMAPALNQCALAETLEFQNIVSFERRASGFDPTLAQCDPASPCTFYFNTDQTHAILPPGAPEPANYDCVQPLGTEPTTSSPATGQSTLNGVPIEGGRCGMPSSGLRITGRNLGMCFGLNGRLGWGAGLDLTFAPPLDASDWDGIAFWVKKGSAGTKESVIFSVVDPYTSGAPLPDASEPCFSGDPNPQILDSEKCDAFGTAVTLSDEWSLVPALFSAMQQKGFGRVSQLGRVDSSQINRLQFLIMAGAEWDFWIDDIALYRVRE